MADEAGYQSRLEYEQRFYKNCEEVHDLPAIFHYWSNKYVRPKLRAIGFDGSVEFMVDPIQAQCEQNPGRVVQCFSVGSGNCDQEIQIALQLRARGFTGFKIECLDLNQDMLDRGQAAATQQGVSDNLVFTRGDFNLWRPKEERQYDAVLAIQALHHVVELEHLFAAIKDGLKPTGVFIVSDMVGRNGHVRWPEAFSIIQEFWRRLPPSYRYNHQLQRYEERFENWDCSQEGFEGIRAQDILPLLNATFHFQCFVAFANVIDPFVDRGFGHNFDASSEWDRAFIDEIQRRDEDEMKKGTVKPTHIYAILGTQDQGPALFEDPLSPSFCVRPTEAPADPPSIDLSAYAWDAFPHDKGTELQIACAHLADAERRIRSLTEEYQQLTAELDKRTAWALDLDRQFEDRTKWALDMQRELTALHKSLGKSGRAALRVADSVRAGLRKLRGG